MLLLNLQQLYNCEYVKLACNFGRNNIYIAIWYNYLLCVFIILYYLLEFLQIDKMNHYMKARTNGINCTGDAKQLKKMEEMFPVDAADDEEIAEALNKHFNISNPQHVRFLQQACFKTPLADVAKVYEEFRQQKFPNIEEPRISNYFENNKFISLRAVEKWLFTQNQYPSLANPENMKQQIAQILLNISEQFGYIPNLQRFLLYYPNYLAKVQKFKNRFFQQRVEETSEVTYLSPKNCCFAGIIAAIQIGCPYMIARMVNMFLVRDGNPSWITDKKYPEQFKPLFGLFKKMAVAPWSLNQNDLLFASTTWNKDVYFDYITAGMFVMSMSTICMAMGLICDQPCKFVPIDQTTQIKAKYDSEKYEQVQNKVKLVEQIKQLINVQKQFTKQQVQLIEGKQVEPYMKQIGNKISTHQLYIAFNKMFTFLVPAHSPINMKAKDNSFFHRYRQIIEKGFEQQRKSDKMQDTKFQSFKSYCKQGSTMTFNNFGKKQQNTKVFSKLIQVLTYNLCGYHNQSFDYKKYIKLNTDLPMPLRFYVKLLSICPLYINKQVLDGVNHQRQESWLECFDLGHLAIMVAENKAKLLMTSIQAEIQN